MGEEMHRFIQMWRGGGRLMRDCLSLAAVFAACMVFGVIGIIGQSVGLIPNPNATRTAEALVEGATATVLALTPSSTPTATNTATATLTPTITLTPSETTITGVTVTSTDNVNLRSGPGTDYPVIGRLAAGEIARAEGRNGDWLYLGDGKWVAAWVVTTRGNMSNLPVRTAPVAPVTPVQPMQPVAPMQPEQPAAPAFVCDCSKTCSQMVSCEEAYFQLRDCGCAERDHNNNGVPCETICR